MEIKQTQEEFNSHLNALKEIFSDITENELFNWNNISAILMLTIKKNWTTASSNSNYQINSEHVKNFFPILQISDSFPHWRLSVPCHVSKNILNLLSGETVSEDWVSSNISYRHKIQNGYPYIQLTLENELRPLKNSLIENDQIFFLKDSTTFNYYVFASREKIFGEESVIITNPSFANVDKTQFEIDDLIRIKSNISKTIIEKQKLKWIIFNSFKYLLQKYEDKLLLNNYKIKESQINETKYLGISIPEYFNSDNLIGQFKSEQLKEKLTSSNTIRYFEDKFTILDNDYSYFSTQWGDVEGNGLTLKNFNRYLGDLTNNSLEIIKEGKLYSLIFKNNNKSSLIKTENTIYYGAPGTGKSYKVDKIIENLDSHYYERITFHPEYDNASFIGGYKPISEKDSSGNDTIKYKFVPQAFTNIYERAWQDDKNQYYLVIEEINRGNCAEIFGEIFQLLDRNSSYTVTPSKELKEYLIIEAFEDENHLGIVNGLKLPPNLSILATMNTSDQSLFPMDSAFKRRWDWEYIPIDYSPKDNDSFEFEIDIEDGKKYNWIKFIEKINLNHIKVNPSLGMDKCIGNYFIKPDKEKVISLKPFINKVIFYLWNDVFKDEDNKVFEENTSYEDFFPIETNGKEKIKELFDRIGLESKKVLTIVEDENQLGLVAEDKEETES